MSFVLLVLGLVLALWGRSAARRRGLWAPAMAGAELGVWPLVVVAGVAALFVGRGWAGGVPGRVGVGLLIAAAIGFGVAFWRTLRTPDAVKAAVTEYTGETPRLTWAPLGLLAPIPRRPRFVRIAEAITYGPHPQHRLDHLAPAAVSDPAPALVYVHGGGWWRGRRNTQARPMLYRLVAAGWHVFTPSYRLSPEATAPDHLVDIKRAIAWVREHAAELGVDPSYIAVAGGSSGGNLAALAALTGGRADLQPGFEDADASVQACVPIYGVHDMLRSDGRPLWPYLAKTVLKSDPRVEPEAWIEASPVRIATDRRPPFFVIHGGADSLVSPDMSRRLVSALRDAGGPPVGYLEVPGANHGFDFFAGVRGRATAIGVADVLSHLHARDRVT